jgi:hypothetical protein
MDLYAGSYHNQSFHMSCIYIPGKQLGRKRLQKLQNDVNQNIS